MDEENRKIITPPPKKKACNLSLCMLIRIIQVKILVHFVPYWFAVPFCDPEFSPDIIIKMETLGKELSSFICSNNKLELRQNY